MGWTPGQDYEQVADEKCDCTDPDKCKALVNEVKDTGVADLIRSGLIRSGDADSRSDVKLDDAPRAGAEGFIAVYRMLGIPCDGRYPNTAFAKRSALNPESKKDNAVLLAPEKFGRPKNQKGMAFLP